VASLIHTGYIASNVEFRVFNEIAPTYLYVIMKTKYCRVCENQKQDKCTSIHGRTVNGLLKSGE